MQGSFLALPRQLTIIITSMIKPCGTLKYLISLLLCSSALFFSGTHAIFPNRGYRNELLNELRQDAVAFEYKLCLACYDVIQDLDDPTRLDYAMEELDISEQGRIIGEGMQSLLVS